MSPKDQSRNQKAQKDELMTKASREGVAVSSSAMAGEASVRGEAVKDEKTKQSRDEAKAKSRDDEGHEPSDDVPNGSEVMFSPKEHEDDDQTDDQEDDDYKDADEDVKGRPQWLPTSFGVYEVASDSGVKFRRPKSLPSRRLKTNPKQEALQAKLKALEKEEERKGQAFAFSPGPSQVVSTQMKKLIDEEIRQRVDEELKKLGRNPRKDVASSVSKAVARKLFLSPDSEREEEKDDDEATQFRKRIQKTFEADELKKQDEALKKKKKNGLMKSRESKGSKKRSEDLNRKSRKFPMLSCSVKKKRKYLKMIFVHGA